MKLSTETVKALVVDDAAFMRKALVEILQAHDGIEVVGVARHGREALDAIEQLDPDVVTLDVDMPVMDGITTIKHIMVRRPLPVVMISGLADEGHITFEALRLGAVDFFPKPSGTISRDIAEHGQVLARAVRLAASVNPMGIVRARTRRPAGAAVSARPLSLPEDQVPPAAVCIVATHGAAAKLFRFLYAVQPDGMSSVWAIVDLPRRVLGSCINHIEENLGWRARVGRELEAEPGCCTLCPAERMGQGGRIAAQEGVSTLMTGLASGHGERFLTIVLGGDLWESMDPFKKVVASGGRILALTPAECVKADLSQRLISQGLAKDVESEQALWEQARNFIRQSALKAAGKER